MRHAHKRGLLMVTGLEVGHDKLDGEVLQRHRGKGRNLPFQPHDKGKCRIGKAFVAHRPFVVVVKDGVIRGLGGNLCGMKRAKRVRLASGLHGGKVGEEVCLVEHGEVSASSDRRAVARPEDTRRGSDRAMVGQMLGRKKDPRKNAIYNNGLLSFMAAGTRLRSNRLWA
jgi:hypothetical protein